MKYLLTYCRVFIFVGLALTLYFLFSRDVSPDKNRINNDLITALFLFVGFLMSFKKSLIRESGAILGVGGIIVGFHHYTLSSQPLISIVYALLFLLPGIVFWFSEKKKPMEQNPSK
jgi:hypothetical protein